MLVRKRKRTEEITKTAVILALALVFQVGLAPLGSMVVGPLVNMVLLLAVLTMGSVIAVLVGGLTPVVAYFLGIMPFLPLVPVIMLGNLLYIISFDRTRKYGNYRAVVVAAILKTLLLAGLVRLLVKFIMPGLPASLVAVFTLPQLYTGILGGAMALLVFRYLPKDM